MEERKPQTAQQHPPQHSLVRLLLLIYRTYGKIIIHVALPLFFIGIIFIVGRQELALINPGHVFLILRGLPRENLLLLGLGGLLAVGTMNLYDLFLARQLQFKIRLTKILQIAWIANTFNNFLGLAGLTGPAVRIYLYRNQGVDTKTVLRFVIYLMAATMTGLAALAIAVLLRIINVGPLLHSYPWLQVFLLAVAAYLPLYFIAPAWPWLAAKLRLGTGINWQFRLTLVAASLLEWLAAVIFFWSVAAVMGITLPFGGALGIYTIAVIVGIFSLAPGGIGSLDMLLVIFLQRFGASPGTAFATVLLYRVFYYLFPWIIGLMMASLTILPTYCGVDPQRVARWQKSLTAWQRFWTWPERLSFLSDVAAFALAALVFLSGLILLISAATPALAERFRLMHAVLSHPAMRLSHHLSVGIGILLIVLSRRIRLKVRGAYYAALWLLIFGALFTFAKGFDYEEAIFLLAVALLLWLSRSRFYREGVSIEPGNLLFWYCISAAIIGLYSWIGVEIRGHLVHWHLPGFTHKFFFNPAEFRNSAIQTLVFSWLIFGLWISLSPGRLPKGWIDDATIAAVRDYLQRHPGNLLTHLLFLRDKQIFFAREHQVLVPYGQIRDKLVVLGEPLGPDELISDGIAEFQRFADRHAYRTVFYQVSAKRLATFHEHGYRFFKLGEEALVKLDEFSLTGNRRKSLRSAANRFTRDGYEFALIGPPLTPAVLSELRSVSDAWLGEQREMGFSLGWFNEEYLQLAPVAAVRDAAGKLVAFASIMPCYDGGQTISVDLMRHYPDTPGWLMEALFINLFTWAKEQGYQWFNLGMAPLAEVGQLPYSLREEKIANLVFQHGGSLYGFAGLRNFKDKFDPVWEPRFLAYPPAVALPVALMEIIWLVLRERTLREL